MENDGDSIGVFMELSGHKEKSLVTWGGEWKVNFKEVENAYVSPPLSLSATHRVVPSKRGLVHIWLPYFFLGRGDKWVIICRSAKSVQEPNLCNSLTPLLAVLVVNSPFLVNMLPTL